MFSVILPRFSGWTLLVQPSRRLQLETGLFKLIAISVRLVEVEASILFSLSSEKKLFLYWNVHKKYLWKKFYLWMLLIWIVYLQIEMPRKHQSFALLNASQYGVFLDDAVRYRFVMRLRNFSSQKPCLSFGSHAKALFVVIWFVIRFPQELLYDWKI